MPLIVKLQSETPVGSPASTSRPYSPVLPSRTPSTIGAPFCKLQHLYLYAGYKRQKRRISRICLCYQVLVCFVVESHKNQIALERHQVICQNGCQKAKPDVGQRQERMQKMKTTSKKPFQGSIQKQEISTVKYCRPELWIIAKRGKNGRQKWLRIGRKYLPSHPT